jgi:hypothetical protein
MRQRLDVAILPTTEVGAGARSRPSGLTSAVPAGIVTMGASPPNFRNPEDRRLLLNDGALAIGTTWAKGWCEDMKRDGRPIAGGWPGTMPEARARVAAYFGAELARRRLPLLTEDETRWAARATYQKAKRDWLAMPMR